MGLRGWTVLAVAGAAGTLACYVLGGWVARTAGSGFPWGTCAIHVAGCLAIGGVAALIDRGGFVPHGARTGLMVGLLGGFTTFSAFGLETLRLVEEARWGLALGYVGLTNIAGLAAVWAGYRALQLLG